MSERTAKGNPLTRVERLQIMLDVDELAVIDDFRFASACQADQRQCGSRYDAGLRPRVTQSGAALRRSGAPLAADGQASPEIAVSGNASRARG